jgi:hypothetical protein
MVDPEGVLRRRSGLHLRNHSRRRLDGWGRRLEVGSSFLEPVKFSC